MLVRKKMTMKANADAQVMGGNDEIDLLQTNSNEQVKMSHEKEFTSAES